MSEKSCNFLGPKERPIDVGSTKAIGLVESRGGDKRLVVQKSLVCMGLNLKGVTVREDVDACAPAPIIWTASLQLHCWLVKEAPGEPRVLGTVGYVSQRGQAFIGEPAATFHEEYSSQFPRSANVNGNNIVKGTDHLYSINFAIFN